MKVEERRAQACNQGRGALPTGTRDFGKEKVKGLNLVPLPSTSITAVLLILFWV